MPKKKSARSDGFFRFAPTQVAAGAVGRRETQNDLVKIVWSSGRLNKRGGKKVFVGIDPGQVNAGVAFICDDCVLLGQILLPATKDPAERIRSAAASVEMSHNQMLGTFYQMAWPQRVCIEGSSFGDPFGQPQLAEARAAMALRWLDMEYPVRFVPPLSIRKVVFGSGKIKAVDVWAKHVKTVGKDAITALACALYLLKEDLNE